MSATGEGNDGSLPSKETRSPELKGEVTRAEEALVSERARLKAALDNIDQGIVTYDTSWRLSMYNQRWVDLLGFSEEFLETTPTLEEIIRNEVERGIDADLPGDTEDKVRAWMQPVLATDGPYLPEQHLSDGTIIELWTNRLPSGGLVRTLTDITSRRRLEQTLRESQQRLRALMDAIPADVTLKDTQGRFVMINKAMSDERHRPEAEVIGKTAYQLYPKEVADDIDKQEREVLRTGRSVEHEYRLLGKDGIERFYLTVKFPILDSKGVPNSVGTTSTDITERRHAQKQLEHYHERVAAELEMARQTQALLMPSVASVDKISTTHDLHIASHFEPSSELGGDLWTLRSLDRERVAVVMADFSGHGVNAALNTFRLHSLLFDEQLDAGDPATYLETLNARLVELLPEGQFTTLFYGIIDRARHRLDYAAAASQNPLIIGPDRKDLECEDSSGLPLGLFEDSVYENHRVAFPRGASLFLYSDALTESMMIDGERFGEDGLLGLVRKCLVSHPRHAFLDTLLERFGERAVRPLKDDLTAVCVTRV